MRVSKDRGSGMEASMTLFASVAMTSIEYSADERLYISENEE